MSDLRVAVYVDGFNLYYGLKSRGWGHYYWNDPHKLAQQLIRPGYRLIKVQYFTARVKEPADKRARQTAYLDALRASSEAQVVLGTFYTKFRDCHRCGSRWTTHEEKMTDTAIGVNLVADAFTDIFDAAFLVGGDTDIVPAIKMVRRHFPKKRLEAWFPPGRKNQAVADVCDDEGHITGAQMQAAIMAEQFTTERGAIIRRPPEWVYRAPKPGPKPD
jgi:hypothetical protein